MAVIATTARSTATVAHSPMLDGRRDAPATARIETNSTIADAANSAGRLPRHIANAKTMSAHIKPIAMTTATTAIPWAVLALWLGCRSLFLAASLPTHPDESLIADPTR